MSDAIVANVDVVARDLGLGESVLINFPRIEGQKNGYYVEHQYPNNNESSVIVTQTGLETINNSETAGQIG